MKFRKALGLLCLASTMFLAGCGNNGGVSSDAFIVDAVAANDALIVDGAGTSYSHKRESNSLTYGKALYVSKTWGVDAKVKDESGNIVSKLVTANITWNITGDGASRWTTNSTFDPDDYHTYYKATYPTAAEGEVTVNFEGTIAYGTATKTVTYKFVMLPKAA